MAEETLPVTSDRPPSILSPYGEGYCRECRFVEPLGPDGLIESHTRGLSMKNDYTRNEECPGSGGRPPKVTPYASRKSAFRMSALTGECPKCAQRVKLTPYSVVLSDTNYVIARHRTPFWVGGSICEGTFDRPVKGSERGRQPRKRPRVTDLAA